MIDEVQTGVGRTGEWFAYQAYGIKPDAISVAKGLGNGYPVGAVVADSRLKPVLGPGTHGTTFGGNPLAMAVCDAVLTEIEQTGLLEQVREKAEYLKKKLDGLIRSLPAVREIRQKGLMVGIELDEPAAPFIRQLLENGLVVLPAGEKVVRLLPPLIVSEEEIDQAASVLHQTLSQTKIGM